jgi:predicted NBD/HSP70 family sugar kinase
MVASIRKVSLLFSERGSGTITERTAFAPTLAAGQPRLLRAINERTVLELLRRLGAMSRTEIARQSGLSKPTVSLALTRLVGAGLAHQTGEASAGKGPSAKLYELNPGSGWVVGIDVGRRWVRAAVADITGGIAARRDERARARSSRALVAQIGEIAHQVAAEAGIDWASVTAATVGSPGVLVPSSGQLQQAPNLPGWGSRGVVDAIRAQLGTVVSFDNDVNLAALGERSSGLGRDVRDFVLLWVGTGVGMGIVIDGELYRGAGGAAGEVGYLPVGEGDPHDRANRRRGMLEEAAAASGIVAHAQRLGMRPPLTPKAVFAAARRGDDLAGEVVAAEARRLALAIAVVAPVLDPELVVLGGGIARNNADLLLEPVQRELQAISPFAPRLAVSGLGEEAVLDGAIATALATAQDQLFSRYPDLDRVGSLT